MKTSLVARNLISVILAFSLLSACSNPVSPATPNGKLQIVASTTIIGDVVRQVAGDEAEIIVLIPPGSDPHTFQARPQEVAALTQADVVFINGFGLEESLIPLLEANSKTTPIAVSGGVMALEFTLVHGDEETLADEEGHKESAADPHTWMDPNNVIVWVENIRSTLSQIDPQKAEYYQHNAEAYISALRQLDTWIRDQVAQIPPAQRKLVTDHAVLGYFARTYSFEQVGLVIPSFSTNAAASAQELADLEQRIRATGVKAIFVGMTINPELSEQIAADTGIQVIRIYTGSLSEAGGEAANYIDFMRYNVNAIVNALK